MGLKKRIKALSKQEIAMIISIILLLIFVVLRRDYIFPRVVESVKDRIEKIKGNSPEDSVVEQDNVPEEPIVEKCEESSNSIKQ